MRFRIGRYLGGIYLLALAVAPAPAQGVPGGALGPSAPASGAGGGKAPQARLRCAEMAAETAHIQGESRPPLPKSYQTEHFVFYYTTDPTSAHSPALDDVDGDGIPDYINNLGFYFEQAWALYTTPLPDGMGYLPPPMKPGSRYPVCVYSLQQGYSGMTWPDSKTGRRATSHISLDAHLYDPYVRQVAAHEFFHAVQFGYNYTASLWWREASADWAAHQVFPAVDTYIIPYYDWFQVPGWSLDYTDGWHEYADSIWPEHLSETRGRDIIRTIWLNQRTDNDSLAAIERSLEGVGTTLAAEFRDFAAWNWFTGDRADGAHYKDAHLYPMIAADDHQAETMAPFGGEVQRLGSAYLALVPSQGATTAARTSSGPAHIAAALVARRRRVSGYLAPAPTPAPHAAGPSGAQLKAADVTALPLARGLTLRLKAEAGLDAQLILERMDGARITVPVSGGRYHVAGFEQGFRRVVVVLSNGDTASKHSFTGSVGLGVVYRDQYGYLWDLEVASTGAIRGTVETGDRQPWPVQGQIKGGSFHWRAINPNPQNGGVTGFDVSGSLPGTTGGSIRWANDTGRSDIWIGGAVDGSAPSPAAVNRRGPAMP